MARISDTEAAQYDRQIRLWGLEAQKRISEARVLLAGMDGLNTEVCKNLVLAGVGHVVIQDDKAVTNRDLASQFFIGPGDIGRNRAAASVEKAQALNPLVKVEADAQPLQAKDDEFFRGFTIICVSAAPLETMFRLDEVCRQHKIAFLAAETFGLYGFIFLDLGQHHFVEERPAPPSEKDKGGPKEDEKVMKVTSFPALEESFSTPWAATRLVTKLLFAIIVFLHFGRDGGAASGSESEDALLAYKARLCRQRFVDTNFVPDSLLSNLHKWRGVLLNPVCAIVGGVLAQEVIKAITHAHAPIENFFVYNGDNFSGLVERLPQHPRK
mmetsp:Transcript_194/g.384  ORF Transcript_194/g.384 Transcript_194/m.384 type:complete len:326 (-) Transcript_194:291-1268(-)|eukprot:CAMPEP_0196657616 /NCGR_PEP_ID=MMETSP1086-20130531/24468_1 /TAXON_ID=77921 /ORGANISM="Cyanoptyche  gloeocystis , Strain SAG4.97" /LENGTH=325 /DNA_ID=CAMNT_0041990809 /DNA_START=187 /DNA_END=1164 /DNA_ORIENTATION=+